MKVSLCEHQYHNSTLIGTVSRSFSVRFPPGRLTLQMLRDLRRQGRADDYWRDLALVSLLLLLSPNFLSGRCPALTAAIPATTTSALGFESRPLHAGLVTIGLSGPFSTLWSRLSVSAVPGPRTLPLRPLFSQWVSASLGRVSALTASKRPANGVHLPLRTSLCSSPCAVRFYSG